MARYKLYKDGEFVNAIEADLMFTMAYCQSQGLTYEEIPARPEPEPESTTEEILLELAADHEERLCMLELGI